MESLSNAAKRKKRKTRKCLDEIRKRSRRADPIEQDNDGLELGQMYCNKNIQKCLITNNRLSLRVFPKVIQSNTITRPALLELERKPNLNINDLVKDTKLINTPNSTKVKIPLKNLSNNILANKRHLVNNCGITNSINGKETITQSDKENDENFDLFSSMDELNNKSPNSIGTQSVSITSTSTQSLHGDNGYSLYEEFMSEVPPCLQRNTKLLQEDIMKKTRVLLQNLYIESCYQECEDNILKCMKNNVPKNMYYTTTEVVHNPMDYIRRGHIQKQSQIHTISGSITGSDSTDSSSHSLLQPPSSLTSPSEAALSGTIHDTPDYTYYPHRLN